MKPTLFILAAGMGSRYGGLKQLDGLGPHGETIMDYSVFDALRAGFGKLVFVIRKDFEQDFRDKILSKYEGLVPVELVFQSIEDLPDGFTCPPERFKPWGTNHAVLMGKKVIQEPFAVINADDFYGREAFEVIGRDLKRIRDGKGDYSMVGFRLGNTMSESGAVSRGICETNDGTLVTITERTTIEYTPQHDIVFINPDGSKEKLQPDTPVSMNLWGFTPDYFEYSEREFCKFLQKDINTPKSEFFIPLAIDNLIKNNEATVKVLDTTSKWFGVTYPEDRASVVAKLAKLHEEGEYPERLFN